MRTFRIKDFKRWPEAVSDGLTLPCACCGTGVSFDYHVTEEFWRAVAPAEERLNVICLRCLDRLANDIGLTLHKHLQEVQFTGVDATIILVPAIAFTGTRRDQKQCTK